MAEIRRALGVSRQRVSQFARQRHVALGNRRRVRYLKADMDQYFSRRVQLPLS